ncbi:MAG: transposase [Burkholderiaceae bacterium]|nr:transposase [Burkholderiaceae bacterium]
MLRAMRDLRDTLDCSKRAAATALLHRARNGQLAPVMVAKLKLAADERGRQAAGDDGLPSVVTLCRWFNAQAAGRSLAPKPSAVPDLGIRGWYRPFFALTDRPQKPTLKWAHEQLLAAWRPEWAFPPGSPPPSYHAVAYAYGRRSQVDRLKGRHTGSALRSKMFFHKRTYHDLAPGTEVHADGWTSHFTAPDPKTGAFVTYEVWHFHDVATRWVPPLAVGLTENTDVILQGLENCIRELGVPCIWQTDHTSSVKNARVLDEHAGLADRLGLTVVHPQTVGNSQANGMAENFNTWLDREARELATYQHPSRMDSGTFVRVRRITNAMVKAAGQPAERARLRAEAMRVGKGIVFDSHAEALAWLEAKRRKWNAHPCRELPKVRDEATGRLVHMSPQQSLDAARAAGWEPVALTAAELAEEFRPHLRKNVTRGTVSPYGGMRYHHADLAHHEGEEVLVAVDRQNAETVVVKDLQGRLIAQAKFVAAVGPRTENMADHADRKRAEQQIRRREKQIEAIEQRFEPAAIELAEPQVLVPGLDAAGGPESAPVLRYPAPPARRDERQMSFLDGQILLAQMEAARAATLAAEAQRAAEQEPEMKTAAE